MSDSRSRDSLLSQGSEALLPGKGHSPSYGINDSADLNGASLDSSGKTATSAIQSIVNPSNRERVWVVAMCSLIACIAAMINGVVIGYSSPTLSYLASDDTKRLHPDHFIPLNSTYASLFAALSPVGAMFGGPIAWPLSERFGRQATMMLSGLPSVFGWVLLANAQIFPEAAFVPVLLVGRFFTGLAVGWAVFGISVYISEIASAKLRGLFGNCNQLFITIGVFIADLFGVSFNGYIVPYWVVALCMAFLVFVFEVLMLFTYETPRWLFSKGKEFEGIHVLKVLRGPNANISKEIDRIRHSVRKTYSFREQLIEFKNRSVYLPFIIVLFLMFFQQFSGINAAVFFASTIFTEMKFTPEVANLIALGAVGATQIIATFIAVILVDFLGRRILLLASGFGMAVSSLMFFVFFIFDDKYNRTIGPLGIVGMVVFIASFSLAWGPIPWSMMSELLPNRVRSLAGSIATFTNWTFAAIVTVAFNDYQKKITPEFAWLSFAIIMVGSIVFVFLFVPETKGRTLEEIQEHFEEGQIFALSCLQRKKSNQVRVDVNEHSRLSVTSVSGYGTEK